MCCGGKLASQRTSAALNGLVDAELLMLAIGCQVRAFGPQQRQAETDRQKLRGRTLD